LDFAPQHPNDNKANGLGPLKSQAIQNIAFLFYYKQNNV
jgi:hypothetical protein